MQKCIVHRRHSNSLQILYILGIRDIFEIAKPLVSNAEIKLFCEETNMKMSKTHGSLSRV